MYKPSERKWVACFKMKAKRSVPGNFGSLSEPSVVNMVTLSQACRDRFIAGLGNGTLQRQLNTYGHRNKEGNIVEFRTVVEIAKNYESSTDARRLMRQVRGDQEQVNWTGNFFNGNLT